MGGDHDHGRRRLSGPPSPEPATAPAARPVLAASGLVKTYGAVTAVDGVSFAVRPGEIVGLVGPNGATRRSAP